MRLRELLQETKKESGWEHLHKTYSDLQFQHDPEANSKKNDATWHHDHDLKPVIHLDKTEVNHHYKTLSKEKFHKDYHHPFFGVVPHERDEANVTLKLMKGEHKEVHKDYPKYKESKMAKHIGGTYDEGVRKKFPPRTHEQFKDLSHLWPEKFRDYGEYHGGVAHEIITSPDPKGYWKHLNEFGK